MEQQVVLLRGINVGGHRKLPMKELCSILEGLGAVKVRTYIQSGNVVAEGELQSAEIAEMIENTKGFLPQVMVFHAADFLNIAKQVPFDEPDGKLAHIWFPTGSFTFNQEKADSLLAEGETLSVAEKAIYLHAPDGIGRSKLAANIEKLAGVPCTARNLNTVNQLLEMLENPA